MFLTKKYIKKINKKAFTLIEISVVILIISVMIVGVITSKSILTKSRLANAQSLTQQSFVNEINNDLIAWYETSLEGSFKSSELKNDGSYITVWNDSNKSVVTKNNATVATPLNTGNQPILIQNVFYNSIPGLRFSGSQYLNFDGTKFAQNSYTVFVVEQRSSNKSENYFIGGTGSSSNGNLSLGYGSDTSILFSHYSNDFTRSIASYKPQTPIMHTFLFNNTIGKKHSINGGSIAINTPAQTTSITSFNQAMIGAYNPSGTLKTYVGDLAEIIMFKRSLKTEEIKAIESYLGSKYGIPVS
jgi:prepilin-type N-terminal cleavage/methylation domain-containing protein